MIVFGRVMEHKGMNIGVGTGDRVYESGLGAE